MKVVDIEKRIHAGETLYIQTGLKTIVVDSKTLGKFEKAGVALFKDDKNDRGFYIAQGKSYVFVGMGCRVGFK